MGVDGGRCRDLAGHAGRDQISPVIYARPSRQIFVQHRTAEIAKESSSVNGAGSKTRFA